jgi:hypothetical protein
MARAFWAAAGVDYTVCQGSRCLNFIVELDRLPEVPMGEARCGFKI